MAYAIKVEIRDIGAEGFSFARQKTMYPGKLISKGDLLFVFASETQGGSGLIARALVTHAEAVPREPGIERQTPLVTVAARRTALVTRCLGRNELKAFKDWQDGRPETELNFKLYRQATNNIVGISDETAAFLEGFF